MTTLRSILGSFAAIACVATPALAQQPTGVWIDHTGRGAVEIKECGDALCGHVVWIKDAKNKSACRTQILGNVRQVGAGTWDRGWIVDPDDNARYSVELKPVGQDRLRVTGYMGSKLFSETMTWRRAPGDLQRCDGVEAAKPVAPAAKPQTQTAAAPPPARVVTPATPAATPAQVPSSVTDDPGYSPIETAPLPQRQATTTPAPLPPIVAPTPPAPAPRVVQPAPAPLPPVAQPLPEPAPQVAEADDEEEVAPKPARRERGQRQANSKRKGGSRECSLDLPYITLRYPCDAF